MHKLRSLSHSFVHHDATTRCITYYILLGYAVYLGHVCVVFVTHHFGRNICLAAWQHCTTALLDCVGGGKFCCACVAEVLCMRCRGVVGV